MCEIEVNPKKKVKSFAKKRDKHNHQTDRMQGVVWGGVK